MEDEILVVILLSPFSLFVSLENVTSVQRKCEIFKDFYIAGQSEVEFPLSDLYLFEKLEAKVGFFPLLYTEEKILWKNQLACLEPLWQNEAQSQIENDWQKPQMPHERLSEWGVEELQFFKKKNFSKIVLCGFSIYYEQMVVTVDEKIQKSLIKKSTIQKNEFSIK